jgi:hypothetical protein
VKRRCYERIGGFDATMLRGQDYDVQIRLARHYAPAHCERPAFVFRQHEGARGPRALRGEGASRADVFRRYSVALGRKVRAEVPLAEFLVPPAGPGGERQALLNRIHVMANHGCVAEMLEDLDRLVELRAPGHGLDAAERESICMAACRGWAAQALIDHRLELLQHSRHLARRVGGAEAVASLARAMFRLARGYGGNVGTRWNRLLLCLRLGWAAWG